MVFKDKEVVVLAIQEVGVAVEAEAEVEVGVAVTEEWAKVVGQEVVLEEEVEVFMVTHKRFNVALIACLLHYLRTTPPLHKENECACIVDNMAMF